jgi:hypothetical protein
LTLVEPADHRREEHSERARIEHGGRVYTTDPVSGLKDPRPCNETLRDPDHHFTAGVDRVPRRIVNSDVDMTEIGS